MTSINDPISHSELADIIMSWEGLGNRQIVDVYARLHLQTKGLITYGSAQEYLAANPEVDPHFAQALDELAGKCENKLERAGISSASVALAAVETMCPDGPETLSVEVDDKPVLERMQASEDTFKRFADTAVEHAPADVRTNPEYDR